MSQQNNLRLIITRAVLWLLAGIGSVVAAVRFVRGLGATTALTDQNPWGLWIGFDVLSGVALAAGGFVIAGVVHVLHLKRYEPLVRPAVLTAFLGYLAVALGLMADLGRPWNIWRPMFFWQPHSPLFEVAWCVMLYLTVLALEVAPVVFEGLRWEGPRRLLRRVTLALVIIGIGLSTLHQSSLGTLFLLVRDRIHPLWYSPLLPLLFFVSAVGLGLAMVITECGVSAWVFRRAPELSLMRGLSRAAVVVLSLYLVLRLGDLWWRGSLGLAFSWTWIAALFWIEILMSAGLPLLLFLLPSSRSTQIGISSGAALAVAGFVLHRADVGGIAHIPVTGASYVPALTEVAVSVGLVAAMALIFLWFIEHFPFWEEPPAIHDHFTPPLVDPLTKWRFGGAWFSRVHLFAVAWIVGAVLGVGLLELARARLVTANLSPIRPVRVVAVEQDAGSALAVVPTGAGHVAGHAAAQASGVSGSVSGIARAGYADGVPGGTGGIGGTDSGLRTALLVDGDRDGEGVLFDHLSHQRRLGGDASCRSCHHWNRPGDLATPCSSCHADMYRCSDTFDHEQHVGALKGNSSCQRCHHQPEQAKIRSNTPACVECHAADIATPTRSGPAAGIAGGPSSGQATPSEPETPPNSGGWQAGGDGPGAGIRVAGTASCGGCHGKGRLFASVPDDPAAIRGVAPGYRDAMHRLCIDCHREQQALRAHSGAAAAGGDDGGTAGAPPADLTRCATCHRDTAGSSPGETGAPADAAPGNLAAGVRVAGLAQGDGAAGGTASGAAAGGAAAAQESGGRS